MKKNERDLLFEKNLKLVYYLLHRMNIYPNNSEYDDYFSAGSFALYKAAQTFDTNRNTKFSSYAFRCVKNEILMQLRHKKKHQDTISLYTPSSLFADKTDILLIDTISDYSFGRIEEIMEQKDRICEVFQVIFNQLKPIETSILLYSLAGYSQIRISSLLGYSQGYASRLLKKIKAKTINLSNQSCKDNNLFTIESIGECFLLSFETSTLNNIYHIEEHLKAAKIQNTIKILKNDHKTLIYFYMSSDSLEFFAGLFNKMGFDKY